ncbi:hypothetical protein Tco_0232116 [Tanacetum coccineum]
MVSDDEDIGSRHIPKVPQNQAWFKPLSEEDRPATPKPAWSIPSSSLPVPINNWASALASSYKSPAENSLLSQTGDIGVFIDWFCKKQEITELTPEHLEGPAYEVVKAFHPDVIHLKFQMEECHKLLTNQVDEGLLRYNVSRPLLKIFFGVGPPGQFKIQTEFFFNKDLEYSICDFVDLLVLDVILQGLLKPPTPKDKKILSTAVNLWIRNLVIRKRVEDFQLGIESYQTQLNLTKPRWEATGLEFMHDYKILDSPRAVVFRETYGMQMIMHFNEIHKFSDETLQQIDEALDYRVKEFKVNKINPGLNTRFWTMNDVIKSQQFMFAIQKRDEYGCDSASMELTTTTSRSSSDVSVALKDDDLVFDDPITLLKSCQGDYLKMNLPDEWVGAFIVPEVNPNQSLAIEQCNFHPQALLLTVLLQVQVKMEMEIPRFS